jgi:hypothetical protein
LLLIISTALKVLSINQRLNTLLDHPRLRLEKRKLRKHLRNQLLVLHRLPRLHDTDNDGLDGVRTILVNASFAMGRLDGRHGNADFPHVARELGGGGEGVGGVDFVAGWTFGDDFVLSAGQGVHEGLQCFQVQVQ